MTQAEIDSLKAENSRLKQQIKQEEQRGTKAKNAEFALALINQGRLAPVARESAVELLNYATAYDNGETLDFAENETLLQKVQAFLQAQPTIIEFTEFATKEKAAPLNHNEHFIEYADKTPPELIELDQKIRAYASQQGIDYKTAFSIITKGV